QRRGDDEGDPGAKSSKRERAYHADCHSGHRPCNQRREEGLTNPNCRKADDCRGHRTHECRTRPPIQPAQGERGGSNRTSRARTPRAQEYTCDPAQSREAETHNNPQQQPTAAILLPCSVPKSFRGKKEIRYRCPKSISHGSIHTSSVRLRLYVIR